MQDIIWKLFIQTGNIETYLLLKEIEGDPPLEDAAHNVTDESLNVKTDM